MHLPPSVLSLTQACPKGFDGFLYALIEQHIVTSHLEEHTRQHTLNNGNIKDWHYTYISEIQSLDEFFLGMHFANRSVEQDGVDYACRGAKRGCRKLRKERRGRAYNARSHQGTDSRLPAAGW